MTIANERFGKNIVDEDGDIRPSDDADNTPLDNNFIIGRDYTLPARRALEAYRQEQAEWDMIEDKNPGPHITLEQLPHVQLALLDAMSSIAVRKAFDGAALVNPEIQNRYGVDLPVVKQGAGRNLRRTIHHTIPELYQAQELIAAGFYEPDVMDDAKRTMQAELRKKYGGPEKLKDREAFRKQLHKKIDK